ncbi:MAG: TadE family protein [Candidatus Omnitrophota bacterium]
MKTLRTGKKWREEKGSSTVEFALVLPALMLVIFGIFEFGRMFMTYQMLNSAAREGARVASLPGADNALALQKIEEELAGAGLTPDSYEFTPADISTASRNDPVTVRVRILYDSIAWMPGFIPGLSGMEMEGVVVMRKEGLN